MPSWKKPVPEVTPGGAPPDWLVSYRLNDWRGRVAHLQPSEKWVATEKAAGFGFNAAAWRWRDLQARKLWRAERADWVKAHGPHELLKEPWERPGFNSGGLSRAV